MTQLVLASSSPYRQQLLERLCIPFHTCTPDIDESARPGEDAIALVKRLAVEKAANVAKLYDQHLIIGSDQVAELDSSIVTKPGNFANAKTQLQRLSGRQIEFHTGLCLLNSLTSNSETEVVTTVVCFRRLSDSEIDRYLYKEEPYDCAGSFKSEQLGISLINAIQSSDPTALIGLPLMRLSQMLRCHGVELP